jgi:uncharacterized protein with FMN-binding domain
MTTPLRTRTAIATFAGLSVIGALAGCSSTSAAPTSSTSTKPATSSGSTPAASAGASAAGSYKDGTYTAPGSYVSPGGEEQISVTLTLTSSVVTALKVVTVKADPTATAYEQQFEGGIDAVTVGKKIDSLNVGVVAGSSLTSMGFNRALATIKADAKS